MVINKCDFCQGETKSVKVYDSLGVFWWLEGVNGAGGDHLAIWCGDCGPKHRNWN